MGVVRGGFPRKKGNSKEKKAKSGPWEAPRVGKKYPQNHPPALRRGKSEGKKPYGKYFCQDGKERRLD